MRVLYLHQYFTTPEIGGATRSYEFGRRLVSNGHDVEFISGPFGSNKRFVDIAGMKINIVGRKYSNEMAYSNRMVSFLVYAVTASLKGMRLKKPDVIYATSTPLTVAIPAIFLSWFFKIPYVFEVRDLWPEAPIQLGGLRNPLLIWIAKRLERAAYYKSSHIIVLSPGIAEGVKQVGVPERKITLIPNSSDVQLFAVPNNDESEIIKKYGINTKKIVLYAGSLGEANGLNVIMKAAKVLQVMKEDIKLVIAGGGKRLRSLQEQKDSEGLNNIVLTGPLSKHEIAQLYRAAMMSLVVFKDISILMTNSPNKFFDSLAAGTPVISNMKGWIKDLIEGYNVGLYFEGEDTDKLVEKILYLASDNIAREEMAKNARKLAVEKFERGKLAAELEKILVKCTIM